MGYLGYPKYVPVAEKRAKAAKKIKQLKKKNPDIKPVVISGNALATTWWGKEWNKNLEKYADYSNRIGRGRSYVRHRAVLDLQINPGEVNALVQGSASRPYSITVKIKAMPKKSWESIKKECRGKLDSLQKLMAGKFPKALNELFTTKGKGLFPSPEEIEFSCSCPDWAYMCKHVAATLYGIGARLDEDPSLFFKLRKVKVKDLVSQAVKDSAKDLLEKAEKKTSRVIDDTNLSDIFGIDLDEDMDMAAVAVPSLKKSPVKKRASQKKKPKLKTNTRKPHVKKVEKKPKTGRSAKKEVERITSKKRIPDKKTSKSLKDNLSAIEVVGRFIKSSKKGVGIPELAQKTGFDSTKVRNIVFRLKKQGRIKNKARGVYLGV